MFVVTCYRKILNLPLEKIEKSETLFSAISFSNITWNLGITYYLLFLE